VYNEHFGFRRQPFTTTPDPRVFYANTVYREAYASVVYGVRQHKGFVLLTGEVGTGKTTVLRRAVAELEPAVRCVLFSTPAPGFDDVIGMVCEELRVPTPEPSAVARGRRLHQWLAGEAAEGRTVALLVDEAQNLDDLGLEQLRLLSNLETPGDSLVQIVLAGQPELETKLERHELRALRQRIALRCRLERLTTDREVGEFVDYRLAAAGYHGASLFPPETIARVARYSSGLPRLINILCDNALLATFACGARRVAVETVDEVARDFRLVPVAPVPPEPVRVPTFEPVVSPPPLTAQPARGAWIAGGFLFGMAGAAVGAAVSGLEPANVLHVERAVRRAVTPEPPITAAVAAEAPAAVAPDPATPLVIPRGATLAALTEAHYGDDEQFLAMDLIQELNAGIEDVDHIRAGARIWLPRLDDGALVRPQANGLVRLIVTSLRDDADARRLGRALEAHGYTVGVTRRALSRTLALSRVEIVDLPDRRAAARAAEAARRLASATAFTTREPSP
jgi:general secretion pathway protein A